MIKVIEGGFKPAVNHDIVAELRRVADAVESGECLSVSVVYLDPAVDHYQCRASASPQVGLLMATLLHKQAVDRLYEAPL